MKIRFSFRSALRRWLGLEDERDRIAYDLAAQEQELLTLSEAVGILDNEMSKALGHDLGELRTHVEDIEALLEDINIKGLDDRVSKIEDLDDRVSNIEALLEDINIEGFDDRVSKIEDLDDRVSNIEDLIDRVRVLL